MQNKYLSALKTRYASFGLSKEALDRVALQRVKTIANEDEIDTDIASSDTAMLIMREMQGSADAQRNRAAQIQKELDDLKKIQNPEPAPQPQPQEQEFAKQMKAMMDVVMGMKAEMEAERKKTQTETLIAQAHELMKKNGCTNDFIRDITLGKVVISDADTAETVAERCRQEYDKNCRAAYGDGYVPPRGNGNSGEADQAEVTKILQERGLLPKSNQ